MNKTCNKCNINKHLAEFYKDKTRRDGLQYKCKVCCNSLSKQWNVDNTARRSQLSKNWREHNKEHVVQTHKQWYNDNKEYKKQSQKLWNEANKDRVIENNKQWAKNNPGKKRNATAKRRAAKFNATLPGYDAELKEIYTNCPPGHHVDHIIPLQGKNVCGLHIPSNLQYLTVRENLSKSNKVLEELHNE